jgi:hypothetical protein
MEPTWFPTWCGSKSSSYWFTQPKNYSKLLYEEWEMCNFSPLEE